MDTELPSIDPNWRPSTPQRKFKARAYRQYAKINFAELTAVQIQTLTGCRSIQAWFENPSFVDWFLNKDHTRQLIEAGSEIALKRLIEILECTGEQVGPRGEVTAAAQVQAAKTLLELSEYAPTKRREIIFKDKDINDMNEDELRDFIQARAKALKLVNSED